MSLKKHIPNTITSMNLLCGVVGVIFTFDGRPDLAFLAMLAAAVFDFCDGLAARALGAYSEIGKELDSLCDATSFGVLPALMLHYTMKSLGVSGFWIYVPLVLAVFSVLRLAKFNVDERQHDSFVGLATPPSAMICASLCSFIYSAPASAVAAFCSHSWTLPALALILSALLVSEIPMFAFKFGKGKSADRRTWTLRTVFLALVAASILVVLLLGLKWPLAVFLAFAAYTLENIIALAFNS